MPINSHKLTMEQRARASDLEESVMDDPDAASSEIIWLRDEVEALRVYGDLVACGLSDHEARGTAWPDQKPYEGMVARDRRRTRASGPPRKGAR